MKERDLIMSTCKHDYELIESKDEIMEPWLNSKGQLTTISRTSKCKKCGHILTDLTGDK